MGVDTGDPYGISPASSGIGNSGNVRRAKHSMRVQVIVAFTLAFMIAMGISVSVISVVLLNDRIGKIDHRLCLQEITELRNQRIIAKALRVRIVGRPGGSEWQGCG